MPNYGDVALGLDAKWDRRNYENNSDWMLYTVGHTAGESDAYLTDDPDKEHQFRWVDVRDPNELTKALMQGYEFVKNDKWTKHEILWAWDAEGFCIFAGQKLLARPKELWLAGQEKRDRLAKEARADSDREIESVPDGMIATDGEGKPIRKRKKGI